MSLLFVFSTKIPSPEGVEIIAEGKLPVATPFPLAVIFPAARSRRNGEIRLSPCVTTKTLPVPVTPGFVGVLEPDPPQLTQTANPKRPARTRYFIPILSPRRPQSCPGGRKLAHICVSGIRGKSKLTPSDWNAGQAVRVARLTLVS